MNLEDFEFNHVKILIEFLEDSHAFTKNNIQSYNVGELWEIYRLVDFIDMNHGEFSQMKQLIEESIIEKGTANDTNFVFNLIKIISKVEVKRDNGSLFKPSI